ncbi:proline racemase family protein [Pseudoalteromonas xiamenensis]
MIKFAHQIDQSLSMGAISTIHTIDMHTAGEPLRIIYKGFPLLSGRRIIEKRKDCLENHDHLRKQLMFEPRGHADMYGAILVGKERDDSDFGVLFTHNEGYSTMCGHAIIALTQLAYKIGHIGTGETLRIDTPAGLVISKSMGKFAEFINVPSFVYKTELNIEVRGKIYVFDIAFGGAFYAFIDADLHNIDLSAENHQILKHLGYTLKCEIAQTLLCLHPYYSELSFLYGVIFYSSKQVNEPSSHSKHVCIFADGELDRSPTGTGVSARAALLHAKDSLALNDTIKIESILGYCFEVSVTGGIQYANYDAVIPKVSGEAYITGKHEFILEDDDPLTDGFIFK